MTTEEEFGSHEMNAACQQDADRRDRQMNRQIQILEPPNRARPSSTTDKDKQAEDAINESVPSTRTTPPPIEKQVPLPRPLAPFKPTWELEQKENTRKTNQELQQPTEPASHFCPKPVHQTNNRLEKQGDPSWKTQEKEMRDLVAKKRPPPTKHPTWADCIYSYYRSFIKNYGRIVRPLTQLLRTGAWHLFENREPDALAKAKAAELSDVVRVYYNSMLPTKLNTNASYGVLAGVLSKLQPDSHARIRDGLRDS
ncbi:hypothetical protein K469DRAFT_798151 [Zopfia rhizophila CBS 207.26]|uniref:Uncharacterized protein n=1 Tax=Zopfia rhizophila CBS 207.26 TaxID=1314779 RepID=A0A6A6DMY0_9PEZI|nr:hypothetical protein K469DRAFT_798151 [Zopfia rhizophila CBS 207.26]